MGCGGTKNRGADTPRRHKDKVEDAPPGKLPALVLEGWAQILRIPLANPYTRTHPPPRIMNKDKSLFSNVQPVSLEPQNIIRKNTSQSSVMKLESMHGQSIETGNGETVPLESYHPSAVVPEAVFTPQGQKDEVSAPVSPLAPRLPPEESDEEIQVAVGDEDRRRELEKWEHEVEAEAVV